MWNLNGAAYEEKLRPIGFTLRTFVLCAVALSFNEALLAAQAVPCVSHPPVNRYQVDGVSAKASYRGGCSTIRRHFNRDSFDHPLSTKLRLSVRHENRQGCLLENVFCDAAENELTKAAV